MRRTETERREYVEDYHRSGLRPLQFCAEHGLNPKTFYTWRRRYARLDALMGTVLGKPRFIPLQIRDDETPGDDLPKERIQLSFKTQNFCLEFFIDAQHNGAELKLIVQTFHELV